MPESPSSAAPIAIIGAGIIGACLAVELTRRGYRVTLIDPGEPGGRQAASYGNGAFISPASILPMSFPGMWRKVPGYLLDPTGPLTIRWRDLPQLAPWLWAFLRSGATAARYERTAGHLHRLLHDAPARHLALAQSAGLSHLLRHDGLIYAFRDRAAAATEARGWELRRAHGVALQELDAEALAQALPDLDRQYSYGIKITEGAHCLDPGAYVAGLVAHACTQGASLVQAQAQGLRRAQGKITAVITSAGDIPCERVILAAGIASAAFLRKLGPERIPLVAERGYHVELVGCPVGPPIPVMPQDGKMANTRTNRGLRAAGQVELTRPDAPPDWRRAEILLGHLRRSYPALRTDPGASAPLQVDRWYGHRPSTPDGLPVIAAAQHIKGLYYAFGHGHVGLATAPRTALMLAELIEGTADPAALAPYAAARFR